MKTTNALIVEAYKQDLINRIRIDVRVEDIVEDLGGIRYTVKKVSKNYYEVEDFDKGKSAKKWLDDQKEMGRDITQFIWVAVEGPDKKKHVFVYGDEGVTKVIDAAFKVQNVDYVKEKNDVLAGYKAIVEDGACPLPKKEEDKEKEVKEDTACPLPEKDKDIEEDKIPIEEPEAGESEEDLEHSDPVAHAEHEASETPEEEAAEHEMEEDSEIKNEDKEKNVSISQLKESIDKNTETNLVTLFNKLVPASGKTGTEEGEIVRAINRLIYRFYNDGDFYNIGYGVETAAPAFLCLEHFANKNKIVELEDSLEKLSNYTSEDEYEKLLDEVGNAVVNYVNSKGEDLVKTNIDMWDFSKDAFRKFDRYEEIEEAVKLPKSPVVPKPKDVTKKVANKIDPKKATGKTCKTGKYEYKSQGFQKLDVAKNKPGSAKAKSFIKKIKSKKKIKEDAPFNGVKSQEKSITEAYIETLKQIE